MRRGLGINLYICKVKRVILVTGGQRSGKSAYAERLALSLSPTPVYMATAHVWDEEFADRVRLHQERRGEQWTNIEEERNLSRHDVSGRVVMVDCLTLWATNFLPHDGLPNVERVMAMLKKEMERLTSQDATFIFVTNELGMGGVSANPLQRRFADLMGMLNQHVAQMADEVVLMVSGIPVKVKNNAR